MEDFLKEAREFAHIESERTGMPAKPHIDLATEMGKKIAKDLGASVEVVEASTLLMDCQLGQAVKEGRLKDHVEMSAIEARKILDKYDISEKDKNNIINSILEHHGVSEFYSLESEITCNADCYRFISVKGFMFAVRYLRDMPFDDLVKILNEKVEEKWNVVSLEIVKKDLEPQYNSIKSILVNLN